MSHPYASLQHMNMLKYFLYIQYGCGEEVRGVVQPQPCQRIIISPHHPQITQIWVNLASSVTVQGCTHMPIHSHMNVLKHFLYIQYGCGEEVRGVVQSTMSTHHYFTPPSSDYPNLGQLGQQCNCLRVLPYAYPQHMNVLKHFLYIQNGCGEEVRGVVQPQPCQQNHYLPPPSPDYQIWVSLARSVTM